MSDWEIHDEHPTKPIERISVVLRDDGRVCVQGLEHTHCYRMMESCTEAGEFVVALLQYAKGLTDVRAYHEQKNHD